jgi:hypothetical protein
MRRSSPHLCGAFVATQVVAAGVTVAVLWQVRDIVAALTQPGRAADAVPHVWLVGLLLAVAAVLAGVQRHVMTVLAERVGMHAMERVLAVSYGAEQPVRYRPSSQGGCPGATPTVPPGLPGPTPPGA